MKNIDIGSTHTGTFEVSRRLTVPELFPDHEATRNMPEVLATAYLVGLIERTCMDLMAPYLEAGEGSLGIAMDLQHSAPTLTGMSVTIQVECLESEGRRMTFSAEARDDLSLIGKARHERAVVNWEKFESRLVDLREKLTNQ